MLLRSRRLLGSGIFLACLFTGCYDAPDPVISLKPEENPPASQAKNDDAGNSPLPLIPFAEAAIVDKIPEGQELPPDRTLAGKATGLLRLAVEHHWDSIAFARRNGKALPWIARVNTNAGEIEITLDPNLAPNHVRNFIALSKAGYFDGLQFDGIVHQEIDDTPVDLVKLGSPLGNGERGTGHIGYFLRPETSETVKHQEGSVGFWHDDDPDSAGCRLYITLGPAPALDGQFTIIGKVTGGLEVVKTIARGPVVDPASYPEKEIPLNPTKIQYLTATPDK